MYSGGPLAGFYYSRQKSRIISVNRRWRQVNGFLVLVQLEDGADDPLAVEPEDEAGGGELGLVAQVAPGQAP